ncbi:MAG: arabinan endo-1,5-alpha-L-arabinosidase [Thalassobius sp.]|nr:arabinan endo-1,5-alpha-L-arabinosidase [Thalassovita sp.]
MFKRILTTNAIALLVTANVFIGCQSKKEAESETKQEEKEVAKSGNPLFEGWYADPEVAIFGDTYWIYPTFSAKYEDQNFFDAFSSKDLVHWEKHKSITDTATISWAERAMWAPCVVEKDGKYYLFFAANDIQTKERGMYDPKIHGKGIGGIGIAVSSTPDGKFEDYLGKPLINEFYNGGQPIDQAVFKDTDGQYYIIYGGWGHCNIGKLKDDFTGLIPFDEENVVKEITPEGYVEGPVMFMRDGWYYLMWSEGNWTDGSYKVAYGRSKSVTGPFDKINTVLQSDPDVATGAGHHSVLNIPGTDDWYVIYHRRPIPNEDRDHRVTCIDRMYFDEDGLIKPIKITFEGVEARTLTETASN